MSNSTLSLLQSVPKATTQVREGRVVEGTYNNNEKRYSPSGEDALDFIGSSPAFKQLFSLPYSLEQSVSVAVHNLGDTLLLDVDPGDQEIPEESATVNAGTNDHPLNRDNLSQALVTLSESEPKSEAIALVRSMLESTQTSTSQQQILKERIIGVPYPEEQIARFISAPNDPREYVSWKFRKMNLLVGSDAFVYRPAENNAVSVRIEDVKLLQSQIQLHQEMQSGSITNDEREKLSYAQVTARSVTEQRGGTELDESDRKSNKERADSVERGSFVAPDFDQVQLQTCLVPSPSVPIGSLLSQTPQQVLRAADESTIKNTSPISTVLDVYLDNIMANVPQLALCLQDKGFVQSVKLLNTEHIPSALLQPSTIDTSIPFQVLNGADDSERIFSPEVMEMNASTLLGFLKAQCTKDNTTYLLRREAGETNIQLYDISAISAQRQQKWNWWLAMMSYRFAHRLRSLSVQTVDKALSRSFRARQRSLLANSLELLDALADMNGKTHESLMSAIRENLADSFLGGGADDDVEQVGSKSQQSVKIDALRHQPYSSVSLDALNKSHDHLVEGIRILWPCLERNVTVKKRNRTSSSLSNKISPVKVISVDPDDDDSSGDEDLLADLEVIDPVVSQLYGLHEKLIDVLLRLAEIHLQNYYSSSAMQTLRSAARRISDSLYLTNLIVANKEKAERWLAILQLQNAWLWEHCGHFARTFAMDELWRERGHASGDDVVSVIQDVDTALRYGDILFTSRSQPIASLRNPTDLLSEKTGGAISLDNLSGVADTGDGLAPLSEELICGAIELLNKQRLLHREQRRVLVVSSIAYGRAISSYNQASSLHDSGQYLGLLQQRLGDSCNEAGKAMMDEVRRLLTAGTVSKTAEALLRSAEFWFREGLDVFDACDDLRNAALLRCNLCQCSKLRANAMLAPSEGTGNHAEKCLQEAAHQLQTAHDCLGQRDTDPSTWDMVSNELAATLLVLGVRRRQSLIGNLPVLVRRLSPGEERSVLDPMENALTIYERARNFHQVAAVHYQLALFYSKIWTCQRDESKTREKLSAAFSHFHAAYGFFSQNVHGNEPTLCILCLDLCQLYSSVSGEEGHLQGLSRCLDTAVAFSMDAYSAQQAKSSPQELSLWLNQMQTLADSVEERVFKILRTLIKSDETGKYKEWYRAGLSCKGRGIVDSPLDPAVQKLQSLHSLLSSIKKLM